MKQKYSYLRLALFFYLVSTAYILYIGIYETIYGLGVYEAIIIQIFGLLIFGISLFLSKFNFRKSVKLFAFLVSIIQFVSIIAHEVDQYKPTYVINIPPNYEGCVYLFTTNNDKSDIEVDSNGIGYMGSKGKAIWEIQKGKESITEAFSNSQQNEIIIRNTLNTLLISYDVACLEISQSNQYTTRQSDNVVYPCMDSKEFLELVNYGIIDEKLLRKKVWNGNGSEDDWVLDSQKSRL